MEKEFVPFEIAVKLKELGFDEPCLGVYYTKDGHVRKCESDEIGDAPLYQQVFRWFREKYKLEGLILPQNQVPVLGEEPVYFIAIISYKNNRMEQLFNSTNKETLLHYCPREDAELACINKLIELVEKPKL